MFADSSIQGSTVLVGILHTGQKVLGVVLMW